MQGGSLQRSRRSIGRAENPLTTPYSCGAVGEVSAMRQTADRPQARQDMSRWQPSGRELCVRLGHNRPMEPAVLYAKSGDINLAYQVIGEGDLDLVFVPGFVSHIMAGWEEPRLAGFLRRLASFSRLVLFDKRGTGMSDPITQMPTQRERVDDIRAVLDAAGVQRAALFGV